MVTLLGAI